MFKNKILNAIDHCRNTNPTLSQYIIDEPTKINTKGKRSEEAKFLLGYEKQRKRNKKKKGREGEKEDIPLK